MDVSLPFSVQLGQQHHEGFPVLLCWRFCLLLASSFLLLLLLQLTNVVLKDDQGILLVHVEQLGVLCEGGVVQQQVLCLLPGGAVQDARHRVLRCRLSTCMLRLRSTLDSSFSFFAKKKEGTILT
uniref:Putative spliceosomal protein fbp11/splicing factor prp40 n=1 Tax=Ixodes ricinus TaxID=34613 RepID=A0A0K8RMZ5_IXORI